jgi:hypothetical protein
MIFGFTIISAWDHQIFKKKGVSIPYNYPLIMGDRHKNFEEIIGKLNIIIWNYWGFFETPCTINDVDNGEDTANHKTIQVLDLVSGKWGEAGSAGHLRVCDIMTL